MRKHYFKVLFAIVIFCILASSSMSVFAAEELSWYIKRNGNDKPSFPKEADLLFNYGAYCIDNFAYDNEEKVIYLTFDAGYENGNIAKILDVLKNENVSAAFFILDNLIYKNPDLVKRMSEEGHLVCNHTKKHKNLCNSSFEEIEKDLYGLEKLAYERCGVTMSKYFRFPEGKYNFEALKSLNDLGYKTFFWSFGYDDWDNSKQPNLVKSKNKILSNTHNGEILLLHPTSKTNSDIMLDLIMEWKKLGYRFGTLDELVENNNIG